MSVAGVTLWLRRLRRAKRTPWWRRNRWTSLARWVGQFRRRAIALAEFIRHVKNLSSGSNPIGIDAWLLCRGAVRTSPLALARSCVCRNLLLGSPNSV
jgi:CBS-domain-containing membrane protein